MSRTSSPAGEANTRHMRRCCMTSSDHAPDMVAPPVAEAPDGPIPDVHPAALAKPPSPAVHRRLPRWSEVRELVQFRRPSADPVRRRLESALTIDDLCRIAMRTTPRAVFD